MASSSFPLPPPEILARLRQGVVIPAHPLALTRRRALDERRQRALTRYYLAAGAGGVAVGVHTTQFAIREAGLYRPVLELAAEEARRLAEQRAAQEKAERLALEKAAQEKARREKAEREKAEREKAAREKAAREQAQREQAAKAKAAQEKAARERAEREQAQLEAERQRNLER
ncbi:MAG: hypothetical protein ACK44W_17395, partial [Planctomycetota bacterium]